MEFPEFCERMHVADLAPELEGIYSTIVAIHGIKDAFIILGVVALFLRAGVPRHVIDRMVLALCKRSAEQLDLSVVGIIRNDTLYFNNKSLGLEVPDCFSIAPGFPVKEVEVLPTISLMVSVGCVRQELA